MLPFADCPTNCVYGDRSVAKIGNVDTHVIVGWTAIAGKNLAKAHVNLQLNSLSAASKAECHDTGADSRQARNPCPDCDSHLNLLVEGH